MHIFQHNQFLITIFVSAQIITIFEFLDTCKIKKFRLFIQHFFGCILELIIGQKSPAYRSHTGQAGLLKSGFEKCIIHHILLTWHQLITTCFQL